MTSQKIESRNSLKVRSGLKAGGLSSMNHNGTIRVHTGVKAGGLSSMNHNATLSR